MRLRALKDLADKAVEELNWEIEGEKLVALYEQAILPKLGRTGERVSAGNSVAAAHGLPLPK